jgi:hypothetical protein
MLRFSFFLPLFLLVLTLSPAQTPSREGHLTIEEVVKLARAGFSEDVIITKIKRNGKAFDLSTAELLDLKKEGLSDNLIKFLLDPSQPYNPPPAAAAGASPTAPSASPSIAKKYPEDATASRVPSDPGLYLFTSNTPAKIDFKILFGTEVGKMPLKKGKAVAYLVGPAAGTRTKIAKPVFYLRPPNGKEIADFVLVLFKKKGDRREIDLGPPGPKQELKADAIRQFDSVEVGQKLFKLVPQHLDPGEYIFFLIGSAEPPKGVYGKGFDFGIDKADGASKVSPEKARRP